MVYHLMPAFIFLSFNRGRGNQHNWLTSKTLLSIFEKHYSVWGEHSRPQSCNLSWVTNIGTSVGKSLQTLALNVLERGHILLISLILIIVALNTKILYRTITILRPGSCFSIYIYMVFKNWWFLRLTQILLRGRQDTNYPI